MQVIYFEHDIELISERFGYLFAEVLPLIDFDVARTGVERLAGVVL